MMNKTYKAALLCTVSMLATPLYAADFFQKLTGSSNVGSSFKASKSLKAKNLARNYTDFSGHWVGTCSSDESSTMSFTLENTDTEITIDGRTINIGGLDTSAESNQGFTYFSHVFGEWNASHTNLTFQMAFVDYERSDALQTKTVFGSGKSILSLHDDNEMVVNMDVRIADSTVVEVCTFHKE